MGRPATGGVRFEGGRWKARLTVNGREKLVPIDPPLTRDPEDRPRAVIEARAMAALVREALRGNAERGDYVDRLNGAAMWMESRVEANAWLLTCSGIYAGWDGRLVKFGITGCAGGLRDRLHTYRGHNPGFRLVAFTPAMSDSYRDLKNEEYRICTSLADDAFNARPGSHRPTPHEWFYPTEQVWRAVCRLRESMIVAIGAESRGQSFDARRRHGGRA